MSFTIISDLRCISEAVEAGPGPEQKDAEASADYGGGKYEPNRRPGRVGAHRLRGAWGSEGGKKKGKEQGEEPCTGLGRSQIADEPGDAVEQQVLLVGGSGFHDEVPC